MRTFGPFKDPDHIETFANIKYKGISLDTRGLTTDVLANILPGLGKRANRWPGSVSYNTFIFLSACQEILKRKSPRATVADVENEAWDLITSEAWVPPDWTAWKRREELRGRR